MSFTPLPKIFTDFIHALDDPAPRILELGCGDGRFREVLASAHVTCWGLDRLGPEIGTVADIVGDALFPPVVPASLDLVLVPNILRHLLPNGGEPDFLVRWLDLLKPGGALFVFEDEPSHKPPGAACYLELQEFLRRLMPGARGSLLALEDFRRLGSAALPKAIWEFGTERNRQTLDAPAVLEFLGQGGQPDGEPGRLMKAIRRDGLDPGHYWWACAKAATEGALL
jgi:SAM-dependent methyltransferase